MRLRFPLAIAVVGTFVCYIADFSTFDRSDVLHFTALYLMVGATTFLTVSLFWRPGMSVGREVLAAALGIFPGVYLPHLVEARIWKSSFNFPEYWGYCVYGVVIATAVSLYLARRRAERDLAALKVKNAEARYDLLKVRMQPHFLFNALNGLSELIARDPARAEVMSQQLSDLYREILLAADRKTTDLGTELSIVKSYLEIESVRFGPRLTFDINAPAEASRIAFPSLMAQTLVENAVKHGISPSVGGGTISLAVKPVGGSRYQFHLRNTGAPLGEGRGNGISNTIDRLNLLYGEDHRFRIASTGDATDVSFFFAGDSRG